MEETTERFSVELARKKGLATLGVALVVATIHSALSYLITIAFGYAEMGVLPAVAPAVVFGAYALTLIAAIVWVTRRSLPAGGMGLMGSLALAVDRVFGSGCWTGAGSGFSPVPSSVTFEAGRVAVVIGGGCDLLLNPILVVAGAILLAAATVHAQN